MSQTLIASAPVQELNIEASASLNATHAPSDMFPLELQQTTKQVFARFMAIYGNKFKSIFDTQDEIRLARREWALTLKGHDPRAIMQAVEVCKERFKWMPSIAEFLDILRSIEGDHGLPTPSRAFVEVCEHAHHPVEHKWSHPAVYQAGKATGWFKLKNEPAKSTIPIFSDYYAQMCERVRNGQDLALPEVPQIEDKSDSTPALTMLEFARKHRMDEAKACQMLAYLNYPEGTRMRRTLRRNAEAEAKVLGIDRLP